MATIQDLISRFKKELSDKLIVNEDLERMLTGIDIIDIATGGLPAGGFGLFTGVSGVGKTLLALNIISSMMKKYPSTVCMIIDAETSLTMERLRQLKIDTNRVLLIRRVTIEDIFDTVVNKFIEIKSDLNINDPSIILWDSIASTPTEKEVVAQKIEEAIGLKARVLSSKLPVLCQKLEKYKTFMIAINQLRENIVINPYDRKEDMVRGLDGSLPGGVVQYYQSSILLRLKNTGVYNTSGIEISKTTVAQTKDLPTSTSFIGYKMDLIFLKNKFAVKRPLTIIMDPVHGINSFFTSVYYLTEYKYISTSGGWYQLVGYPKKFRLREIQDIYNTTPEFKELFDKYYQEVLDNIKSQLRSETGQVSEDAVQINTIEEHNENTESITDNNNSNKNIIDGGSINAEDTDASESTG
jgi:RecA/RadA recombinase